MLAINTDGSRKMFLFRQKIEDQCRRERDEQNISSKANNHSSIEMSMKKKHRRMDIN